MNLYINQLKKKSDYRSAVYSGDTFLNTDLNAPKAFCAFAKESIIIMFGGKPLPGAARDESEEGNTP